MVVAIQFFVLPEKTYDVYYKLDAMPHWDHSRNWGDAPRGGLCLALLILVVLLLRGSI